MFFRTTKDACAVPKTKAKENKFNTISFTFLYNMLYVWVKGEGKARAK